MTNNGKPVKVLPAACVSGTAISSMGMAAPPPVESAAVPAPQPSQRIYPERVPDRGNTLPKFNSVSLRLRRLRILHYQGLCWFWICCSLSSLETIYKPVCLEHYWVCLEHYRVLLLQSFQVKGRKVKLGHMDMKWKHKRIYIWMMAVYGTCKKEVCSSEISEEVK